MNVAEGQMEAIAAAGSTVKGLIALRFYAGS